MLTNNLCIYELVKPIVDKKKINNKVIDIKMTFQSFQSHNKYGIAQTDFDCKSCRDVLNNSTYRTTLALYPDEDVFSYAKIIMPLCFNKKHITKRKIRKLVQQLNFGNSQNNK